MAKRSTSGTPKAEPPTIRALRLISTRPIRYPGQFAELMWPGSLANRRSLRINDRQSQPGGLANRAAGGFLGRLRAIELIAGGKSSDYALTDKGAKLLSEYDAAHSLADSPHHSMEEPAP